MILFWAIFAIFFLSTGSYLLLALLSVLPPRDLKKVYNAKWALVTGASSGALDLLQDSVLIPKGRDVRQPMS